jgi:hypothetical protein
MQKQGGWVWVVGILGYSTAAIAQTPPAPTAGTRFDGRYAFVSATKLNDTYMTPSGRMGQCPDPKLAPLIIQNGQARRYSTAGVSTFEGTVGPGGELTMRFAATPTKRGAIPGVERTVSGRIDQDGTVHARQISRGCNYDIVWQRESR